MVTTCIIHLSIGWQ